jgi:hypothetical protein
MRANQRDVLKGAAAGLVGGLIASWTMNRFQDLWMKLSEGSGPNDAGDESGETQLVQTQQSAESEKGQAQEQDDATVNAASAISEGIFDHKLTKSEKNVAGPAVHYALGTTVGGVYGALAELVPETTAGAGLPFGTVFWLVADEGAVPLLGLSKPPTEYPVSTHVYALASHLVYGLTTECVRRTLRQ